MKLYKIVSLSETDCINKASFIASRDDFDVIGYRLMEYLSLWDYGDNSEIDENSVVNEDNYAHIIEDGPYVVAWNDIPEMDATLYRIVE